MNRGQPKHIVGGSDVTSDEFSFVAKIIYRGSQVGCTGSLISPNKVLTAAHCVGGYSPETITVGFGNRRSSGYVSEHIGITEHPDGFPGADIAVIELQFSVPIDPVRLLTLEEELRYVTNGSTGTIVGWGGTESDRDNSPSPDTLQKLDVPIYTPEGCRQVLRDLRDSGENPQPPAITEQTLCAGETDKTPWYGDSGGPLLVDTPDGWAQVGVLSQATNNPDGSVGYLGNYMRTSYFWDWIFPTYFLHFAHSARGGGWRTDLVLLNLERDTAEATVDLFGQTRVAPTFVLKYNIRAGPSLVLSPERSCGSG